MGFINHRNVFDGSTIDIVNFNFMLIDAADTL